MRLLCRSLLVLSTAFVLGISVSTAWSATLVHRYSFDEGSGTTLTDSIGGTIWNGTLPKGGTWSSGEVSLAASSQQYVQLPGGILSNYTAVTVEAWVTFPSALPSACFLFGFGNVNGSAGEDYIFCQPRAGRIAITDGGSGSEQNAQGGGNWSSRTNLHVAAVFNPPAGQLALYTNGVLAAVNNSITIPFSSVNNVVSYIGRSLYSADSYFNFNLSEFRLYNGALTPAEIQTNYLAGPDPGPAEFVSQPRSQVVAEMDPATFSVLHRGTRPVSVQWQRNGTNLPNATNLTYSLASVAPANQGDAYRVVLTNRYNNSNYTAISSNAVLTVITDLTAPVVLRAMSLLPNEVLVQFSEPVSAATGTNQANYIITHAGGALSITGARFGATANEVILTTAAQALGTNYTLTVNGVRDRAGAANLIAANSQTSFVPIPWIMSDVGSTNVNLSWMGIAGVTNGLNLTGSGSGVAGTADQFAFGYQTYTGNFDVQVRVGALSFASAWTRAGLMARGGLASNALFAASFATPGPAGCHFESRVTVGAGTTLAGSFPVNFPDTWLRLRRVGNVFDGFASLDGQTWEPLGTASITMSNAVQVGLAVTAGNAAASTTAQFRDFAPASGVIATNTPLPFELPGPSSRATALVITEIMYNPPDAWDGTNNLEFVELWNSGLVTEDLTGFRLAGEIDFAFPTSTTIAPGQFLVIARDPAAAQSFYGVSCLGPYTGKLANGGGTLRLLNELGGRLLQIEYDNKTPWPVAPDGAGHSLVLTRPSYGENDARAWSASAVMGGSPGAFEHYASEPARGVVFNEFLAHTDLPQVDFVELFNTRTQPVDLSGAWLSDKAGTNLFRIPDGTIIPARGFLAYTEPQLGFALAADGESILLVNSNQTRVLDAVRFEGQENGVSSGRFPDGAPGFQPLSTPTFGSSNTSRPLPPLVINEIMYHPITEANDDEYVEIYNRSGAAVNLAGWQLQGGISFTFPQNASIAAGGYVVVAANRTNLLAKYPQLNTANTFGDFSGALANNGERIALAKSDDLISTNAAGVATTNWFSIVVDEVTYAEGGRWGKWSDGGGSSLELVDPNADSRLAANWADSDESAKAAWTWIDVTNVMENGQPGSVNEGGSYGQADRYEAFLQGPGEALLDNMEFRSNGGANLIPNGTFETGLSGWLAGGVLRQSYVEPGTGVGGSQALHLVSADRGDTGPNKLRAALSATAATDAPNTGTFRAAVRWLKGSPYILLRIRGNWAEVSQRLTVPPNCGTPGQANSRAANPGPAIYDVTHTPSLPAANQPVVVTARAADPNGVASLTLRYRIDPSTTITSVPMLDNGTGGDAIAGDGLYSATLPGNASGVLSAFTLMATDGTAQTSPFPAEAGRECLVRWGEPSFGGSIATYRLWVTSSNINFWAAREKNANDPMDATFVYGNSRVCYNVNTLYSGSPFHAPSYNGPMGTTPCDYEVNFPPDDRFLGSEPFVLTAFDAVSQNWFMNDDSAQVDLTAGWIGRKLGQQYTHRRHIHVIVNGLRRGTIYDDAQQPNREMLDQYFPKDERGQLRKIESWFEFQDDDVTQGSTYTTLTRVNKSTGDIDPKRYRWNWRPRATDDPNNWADFLSLIEAVNNTNAPNHEAQVRQWMDVRNFLGPIVTHHICGSWDSYGYERGKNMFAYKPDNQGWRLQLWDLEISLGAGGRSATDSIYNMFDKTLLNLITNRPAIHREYLRGFQEALDTTLQPGAAHAVLDERYAAFQQNNVAMVAPTFIKTYLNDRRNYLLGVIRNAPFAIATTNQTITSSNVVTLTGTAPLSLENILVNSNAYAVHWTSISNWSVTVPLVGGSNVLNIAATDRNGRAISNATGTVGIHYTGATAPESYVVLNEVHYAPAVAGGAFIELFNTHSSDTRDLSGWSVNGLGYTFPSGSVLAPRSYLVLAEDPFVFNQIYGASNVAFDTYDGALDRDGETLTLFRPSGASNAVVDRVRYEAAAPWPVITNGASLQLRDAAQDNSRVANWAASLSGLLATPGASNSVATNLPVFPPLWLNEAQALNLTGPLDNYSQRDPWTEIHNAATTNFTLTNFFLSDNYTNLTRWAFPVGTVVSNSNFKLVWCDNQTNQTTSNALHAPFTLGAASESLVLSRVINGLTQVVDYLNYTNLPANWSYGSVPEAQPFYRRPMFFVTPGATNNGASQPITIFINEWLADNSTVLSDPADGQFEDWFELYNPGTNAADLGGYYLTDNLTNKLQFQIPDNGQYVVPAGGYLLVWADSESGQNSSNRADLHVNFALSKSGEALGLFAADGTTVDAVPFGAQTENVSEGRFPNGSVAIWSMPTPTPRAANVLSNMPPVLAPIANRLLIAGQTLALAASGTDPDSPTQTLTYSLSAAPNGATIHPSSGLLTWTPLSPTTNTFNIIVTDNGTPPMSATQGFSVVVLPRPALQILGVAGGGLSLHWESAPDQWYQAEFKEKLTDPSWLPASEIMAGTGEMMSVTNAVEAAGQRFFRLRILP